MPASASTQTRPRNLCKGIDGNCSVGFTQCATCSSDVGDGSFCWEILNRKGEVSTAKQVCAEDMFCNEALQCAGANDCPKGQVCATANGCTGCGTSFGVCTPKCWTGLHDGPSARRILRLGRTMTGR
jgi:hypothetical protein